MVQTKRSIIFLAAFLYTTLAGLGSSAMAADTEIYLDTPSSTGTANVLFILDTSTSMRAQVDENNDGILAPGERSRIEVLKAAMTTLLDTLPRLNVGLMRYNYYGGSLLFPVSDLDESACDVEGNCVNSGSGARGIDRQIVTVSNNDNDAEEYNGTTVVQSNSTLTIGVNTSGSSCTTQEYSFPIRGIRDMVEAADWNPRLHNDGGDLRRDDTMGIPRDANDVPILNGLWFRDVTIPAETANTKLLRANITFTIAERVPNRHNQPSDIHIYAVEPDTIDVSEPRVNHLRRLGYRPPQLYSHRFPTPVEWNIPITDDPDEGEPLVSADITPLIREVLRHGTWPTTTKNMAFLLEQNVAGSALFKRGIRVVERAARADRPTLNIAYQTCASTVPSNVRTALRFPNVNIPQGAKIDRSRISFTAAERNSSDSDFIIKMEDTADASPFSASPISNRNYKTVAIPWTSAPGADSLTTWQQGVAYSTPDLTKMIQGAVSQASWCGGNDMSFLVERSGGAPGKRTAYAYDGDATRAPVLYVSYVNGSRDPGAARGNPDYCSSSTISRKVSSSSDDGEENVSGAMNLGSSDLELSQNAGLRFQDIPIAPGAKIVSARLIFTADEPATGSMTVNFYGQASDNASAFSSGGDGTRSISGRPRTVARVAWSPPAFVNINDTYELAGLEGIIQNIVDRPGWARGNAIAILMSGSGSVRRAVKSYDVDNGANAPVLEITFQGNPVATRQTVRERLKEIVDNSLALRSGTPILGSMIEAARYLRGERVIYGRQRGQQSRGIDRTTGREKDTATRISHEASYDANGALVGRPVGCHEEDLDSSACVDEIIFRGRPTYRSPIVAACQTNYIINLTDGRGGCTGLSPAGIGRSSPSACQGKVVRDRTGANMSFNEIAYAEAFASEDADGNPVTLGRCVTDTTLPADTTLPDRTYSGSAHNECAVKLTQFLHDNDQIYTSSQNLESGAAPIEGLQSIRTYTIGFNLCGTGFVTSEDASGKQVCCAVDNHDRPSGTCSTPEPDPDTITVLKAMADVGGGQYFNAGTAKELLASFNTITSNIIQRSTSFVAPSIAANAFNRLESRDEVYFGLFEPNKTARWPGNVKKYRLCDDSRDGCTPGSVLDATGLDAIVNDPGQGDDGLFRTTATSFWTGPAESPDGREITLGGAGGEITDFRVRTIYTEANDAGVAASGTPLATGYAMNSDNWNAPQFDNIRGEVCPAPSTATASDCEDRMLFILGQDATDEDGDGNTDDTRWWFSDVLHSSPKVVTYGRTGNGEFIDKVFVATNDGALHAINGLTGVEEWAFMPNAVFPDQRALFDNSGEHVYGLDSTPTLRVRDVNGNGIIEPDLGDLVHIYVAQRRGGRNLYALDITPSATLTDNTTPVVPRFLWRIEGGSGDFARMGYSWSEPRLTTIQTGETGGRESSPILREVLIFGGGYDNDLDDVDSGTVYNFGLEGGDPNEGNAIYVVDADTGALIFWISSDTTTPMSDGRRGADIVAASMNYAIPSTIAVNDTDGDGLGDRLYVGDTAGQVWRVDIADDIDPGGREPQGSSVVGRLASISTAGVVAEERRFYVPPAVVQVVDTGTDAQGGEFDYVLIPSGYRAHPLDTNVRDRLYAFRDSTIDPMIDCSPVGACARDGLAENYPAALDRSVGALGAPITNGDLANISSSALVVENADGAITRIDGARLGWYFDFNQATGTTDSGEKGLSPAAVFDGTVILTTFIPSGPDDIADPCSASDGSGAAYNFNLLTGEANLDWDGDGDITMADRRQALGSGIPSEAVPIFTKEGVTILVGTGGGAENLGQVSELPRYRTYWYEES